MMHEGLKNFVLQFPFPPRLRKIRVSRRDFINILADMYTGYPTQIYDHVPFPSIIEIFDTRHGKILVVRGAE